jgi:hypothetical protein
LEEEPVTPSRKRGKGANGALSTPGSAKRKRGKKEDEPHSNGVHGHEAAPASPAVPEPTRSGPLAERGDLKELETLFNLYRGAGRTINLWDWLEGFRAGMVPALNGGAGNGAAGENGHPPDEPDGVADGEDDEAGARLHAAFVRFCEEARMVGLIRARGSARGRRVDEVIKSIGYI